MLPRCVLHAATGLDCPLCGGTRAALALARGDVAAALDHNLLLVAAAPFLLALVALWAFRRATRPAAGAVCEAVEGSSSLKRLVPWALVVLGAFFVARNLPFAPFTYLDAGIG